MGYRGRPARPKYLYRCDCGWQGKRTKFTAAARGCPKCRKWNAPKLVARDSEQQAAK